jgi:BirA family transcriptional regulator, biotin operon repressor / biotin---[acetyl-CoA-carboxylase] ligase
MSLLIGNKIIKLITVDSTNNYATAHLFAENWTEGTIVQALYQNNGKGQLGNYWESEHEKNLLCSVVLQPRFLPVQKQFLISKVVSLSVSEVVQKYVEGVKIKWPNDIYVGSRKVAGILIENSIMGNAIEYSVVGIGLNVNQQVFTSPAPNPVSLVQITNKAILVEDVLNELIESLDRWYGLLAGGYTEPIDRAYEGQLYQYRKPCLYRDKGGDFSGTLLGVNAIGQLIIQPNEGKKREYHFKEVSFL